MTSTAFKASVRSKAHGSWNLHKVLPNYLDFFIPPASSSGIVGNRGQGNYNVGSTFQDALSYCRRSRGLRGTSLDLGHMRDVGVSAEPTDDLFAGSLGAAFGNQAISQNESMLCSNIIATRKTQMTATDCNRAWYSLTAPCRQLDRVCLLILSPTLPSLAPW